jgi:uncharacterized damage-inducible protein DinB
LAATGIPSAQLAVRSPLTEIRQNLHQSRQRTLQLIRPLNSETAGYRPRPNAWSIKDHVVHLIAVEESVIHFAHRILDEDCPVSPLCYDLAFNQDAWNNRQITERAGYTWSETLRALEATRHELLTLLENIPLEALQRLGSHPVWGDPVTLESVLRVPYRHERNHRDEMAALVELMPPAVTHHP